MIMKKIFSFVLALLCASVLTFATDWSSIAFLADGAGEGAYANKYKVEAAFGQNVVNIQKPGFAAEAGIYTNFPAGISSCDLPAGKYAIEGAGVVMYLSAFTAKETAVSVEAGGVNYDFKVFYADGTGEIDDNPGEGGDPHPGDLTPATFYGRDVRPVAGTDVTFDWSITRNADATLTFEISWSSDITGVVPQVSINDVYTTLPMQGTLARFTTKETYTDGDKPTIFFLIAYTGNAARIDVAYTVGASNEKPGDEPGDEPKQGINNASVSAKTHKIIENGQIVLIKNGMRYNILGSEIK